MLEYFRGCSDYAENKAYDPHHSMVVSVRFTLDPLRDEYHALLDTGSTWSISPTRAVGASPGRIVQLSWPLGLGVRRIVEKGWCASLSTGMALTHAPRTRMQPARFGRRPHEA